MRPRPVRRHTLAVSPPRSSRRWLLAAVLAAGWLLVSALPAWAHASLVETVPAGRAVVDAAPETVVLRFSESLKSPPDGVRLYDAEATRVDEGAVETADPTEVAVALPEGLADGGYVVTYRVVSADSHVVSGTFLFTVGDGDAVDDAVIADLFGGAGQAWTGVVGPVLRALSYLGVLLAAGAAAFAAWVAGGARDREAPGRGPSAGPCLPRSPPSSRCRSRRRP